MTTPYPDLICRGPAGVFHRIGDRENLVWENPQTGEIRFCPARRLPRFADAWAADSARIVGDIETQCRCGPQRPHRDCAGWREDEVAWFELVQPLSHEARSQNDAAAQRLAETLQRRRWFGPRTFRYRDRVNPRTARVGDLDPFGSRATSVVERQIRAAVQDAGHLVLPPGMRVWSRPDNGGIWYCTPDIIICPPRGRVIAVEVDPLFTHSGVTADGENLVERDRERNRMYARAGWKVVRIRLDGAKALTPNDMVLPAGFDAGRDTAAILAALAGARFYRAGRLR